MFYKRYQTEDYLRVADECAARLREILQARYDEAEDLREAINDRYPFEDYDLKCEEIEREEQLVKSLLGQLDRETERIKEDIRMEHREKLLVVPGTGRIDIFFDENLYLADLQEMQEIAMATVFAGETTGFDLSRADYGHICCYYNPTRMDLAQAQKGCRRMTDYILSCS